MTVIVIVGTYRYAVDDGECITVLNDGSLRSDDYVVGAFRILPNGIRLRITKGDTVPLPLQVPPKAEG